MFGWLQRKQPARKLWVRVLGVIGGLLFCWLMVSGAHLWVPPAVDLARSIPGVGFGRMHRFEQAVFMAWDHLQRVGVEVRSRRAVRAPAAAFDGVWPPTPLTPLFDAPASFKDEGIWSPVESRCLKKTVDDEAPVMMSTRLRVDPERPDVDVSLVAIDMRALSLGLVVGSDDDGPGQVEPGHREEVVAAFNGGFQRKHGEFGVRGHGRTFVDPLPGAATVAVDREGRLWLGAWPAAESGQRLEMFRQNLQLLQEGSRVDDTLSLRANGKQERIGHSPTRRSGLCFRGPHTLIYLWTPRGQARSLAEAMIVAGCQRGMHLDLNAYHTRFEFLNFADQCADKLHTRMTDGPEGRYLTRQGRDFFVLKRRERPLDGAPILLSL